MAITQVRAQINGTWYTLTATGTAGQYTAQITAPGATSYNQPGGYYNVTVEATNTAGTTGSADAGRAEVLRRGTRRAGHHDPVAVRRRLCFQ